MSQAPAVPESIDLAAIGENVPLLEGIRTTRAIRRLRPDPERRAFVAARYRWAFDEYIAPVLEAVKRPDYPAARRQSVASAVYLAEHLHEAPVHLFVAGRTRRGARGP